MACVTIAATGRRIDDSEQISEFLAPYGIWYERWDVAGRIGPDATSDEILAAYAPEIDRLKSRGGYVTADVIKVAPETPGLDAMLARFSREHTHDEDEVRFIVCGRGIFQIHPDDENIFAIQVDAGDLINVPAGTRHWFDLCVERVIHAIRLFRDPSGWNPNYTNSNVHLAHPPVCWGPAWLPVAELDSDVVRLVIRFAGSGMLLDIEGTVSSIRFVYDVMFPYVRSHLAEFLHQHLDEPPVRAACDQTVREAIQAGLLIESGPQSSRDAGQVIEAVGRLMDADAKATGLKDLQGIIWEGGFRSGELRSQVFDDVPACLADWQRRGIDVRIYSSGSIAAQKLFFSHSQCGDLTSFLSGYYDTTTGPKREPASYQRICYDMYRTPGDVLFLSDVVSELDAASDIGMATALVRRPGNPPPPNAHRHSVIDSLAGVI